jgi:hypothetical protein
MAVVERIDLRTEILAAKARAQEARRVDDEDVLKRNEKQKAEAGGALFRRLLAENLTSLKPFLGLPQIEGPLSSATHFVVNHPNLPKGLTVTVVDKREATLDSEPEANGWLIFSREPGEHHGNMWDNDISSVAEYLDEIWLEDETVLDPGDDGTDLSENHHDAD